jgi:hypothetical protein
MESLRNSTFMSDNNQSIENLIDEREQLLEDTIEMDKQLAIEEAEQAK